MLNGFCGILFIDFGHACLQCGTINDKIHTKWNEQIITIEVRFSIELK